MAPDEHLVRQITDLLLAQDKVLGVHDLMIHDYGPGRRFASAHVEMDYREDVLDAHERIDELERQVRRELGVELVIHYDPIVTDDEELTRIMHAWWKFSRGSIPSLRSTIFAWCAAAGIQTSFLTWFCRFPWKAGSRSCASW